jgi:hypothetical protein
LSSSQETEPKNLHTAVRNFLVILSSFRVIELAYARILGFSL